MAKGRIADLSPLAAVNEFVRSWPHLINGSVDPVKSDPKRHLDWFSRLCRAHERDQQTDIKTDTLTYHATPSVATGGILCTDWPKNTSQRPMVVKFWVLYFPKKHANVSAKWRWFNCRVNNAVEEFQIGRSEAGKLLLFIYYAEAAQHTTIKYTACIYSSLSCIREKGKNVLRLVNTFLNYSLQQTVSCSIS